MEFCGPRSVHRVENAYDQSDWICETGFMLRFFSVIATDYLLKPVSAGILPAMKTVTIQDIARVAGVSKSTVSRVLNGTVAVTRTRKSSS